MAWEYEGHSFRTDRLVAKIAGRAVCTGCGLMRLHNLLTDWCVSKGCNYQEHPEYRRMHATLPKLHQEQMKKA